MTHNQTVRTLQIINHILALFGLIWMSVTTNFHYLWFSVSGYVIFGMLGINVGYHRLISHRSYITYDITEKILGILGVLATVGSPLGWSAIHRQHHRCVEREGDPHSPHLSPAWRVWFGLWRVPKLDARLVKDLRSSGWYRFLHKQYHWIIAGYVLILALIDPLLVIFAYALPATMVLHGTSVITVWAHKHGYRNHDLGRDQSRNSWLAHLFSLGEGWHNNHHAAPWRWNTKQRWWEIDPPAAVIRLIKSI